MKFLVDSGSMVSIIPLSAATLQFPINPVLIICLHSTTLKLKRLVNIGLKSYPRIDWSFVVTDSNIAILGANFLSAHNLMIDLKSKRLN